MLRKIGDTISEDSIEKIKKLINETSSTNPDTFKQNNEENSLFITELIGKYVKGGISVMMFKDGKETLIYANDRFYNAIGKNKEDYVHENNAIINRIMEPAAKIRYKQCMERSLQTGEVQELEYKFKKFNGQIIWVKKRFVAIPQKDQKGYLIVAIALNVTKRKGLADEIKIQRDRFELVIEQTGVAIAEWNYQTNEFYCTESFKNYELNKTASDNIFRNRKSLKAVHPDDINELKAFFKDTTLDRGKVEGVVRLKMTDGTYRWSKLISMTQKDESGNRFKTIVAISDMHEEMERNFELEKKYEQRINFSKVLGRDAMVVLCASLEKNTITIIKQEQFGKMGEISNFEEALKYTSDAIIDENEKRDFNRIFNIEKMKNAFEAGQEIFGLRHHFSDIDSYYETRCEIMRNPRTKGLEAYFIIKDITEKTMAIDVMNAITTMDYDEIFTIDAETGQPITFKKGEVPVITEQNKVGDYEQGLCSYILKHSADDNPEQVAKELNREYVTEMLEHEKTYRKVYSLYNENGDIIIKRAFFTYLNNRKKTIVCTVIEIGRKKKENH